MFCVVLQVAGDGLWILGALGGFRTNLSLRPPSAMPNTTQKVTQASGAFAHRSGSLRPPHPPCTVQLTPDPMPSAVAPQVHTTRFSWSCTEHCPLPHCTRDLMGTTKPTQRVALHSAKP